MTRSDWPLVLSNDTGLRPIMPGVCFYCRRSIGEPHGLECVCVTKRVELQVTVGSPILFEGVWPLDVPHSWGPATIEFHRNQGTWCADNFFDHVAEVRWNTGSPAEVNAALEVLRLTARREGRRGCLCGSVRFAFVRVVDDTPRRKVTS